jgi:hypothetical protein
MTMATDTLIEQYIAEKKALISEVSDDITLIFQKLERSLLELIDHLDICEGSGEDRYAAFLVARGADAEDDYDDIPQGVRGKMRAQFEHFTQFLILEDFCTSFHDSVSLEGDRYGYFEISFTELTVKRALVEAMGVDMKEPITITWDLLDLSAVVEVRFPIIGHLELEDLNRFVAIFRRTWGDELAWAKMQ